MGREQKTNKEGKKNSAVVAKRKKSAKESKERH